MTNETQSTRAGDGKTAQDWEGADEWMPLAWELCANEHGEEACTELIWEGGPIPEPWGDRWLKYEDQAKEMIAMVRKHVPAAALAEMSEERRQLQHLVDDIVEEADQDGHTYYRVRDGADVLFSNMVGACARLLAQPAAAPAAAPAKLVPLTDYQIVRIYERPELAGTRHESGTEKAIAIARAIEAAHGIQAPATVAPTDDPDDITHRFYEVRQDREMLAQALRALLADPTDEAKEHARLALGDLSHG